MAKSSLLKAISERAPRKDSMEDSSLLKIICEKVVKPSSPTPPSSRYYKVNAIDASFEQSLMINVALFYPKESFHGGISSTIEELFEVLETSLSKILTYYYPFAGRFMEDNITIDCNDDGVQLWKVQIKSLMSDILDSCAEYSPWNSVFLRNMYRCDTSLIMIQLNYFECGGICVIISMSHKLGDGTTLSNFINDWGVIARKSKDVPPPAPVLLGASIFSPSSGQTHISMNQRNSNLVTQRFVFSTASILELKRKVIKATETKNPTQVEVVTAFIFKYLMSTAKKLNSFSSSSSSFQPTLLFQVVNIRPIPIPPLSEQMVGNFVSSFFIIVPDQEKDREFLRIVIELRKSKVKFIDSHKVRFEGYEFHKQFGKSSAENQRKIMDKNFDVYIFSSWFRFPLYEADFGFGKPIFVCQPGGLAEKTTFLMATPNGDGINVFVTLKLEHMSIFQQDEELLAFASLNPKICTTN